MEWPLGMETCCSLCFGDRPKEVAASTAATRPRRPRSKQKVPAKHVTGILRTFCTGAEETLLALHYRTTRTPPPPALRPATTDASVAHAAWQNARACGFEEAASKASRKVEAAAREWSGSRPACTASHPASGTVGDGNPGDPLGPSMLALESRVRCSCSSFTWRRLQLREADLTSNLKFHRSKPGIPAQQEPSRS